MIILGREIRVAACDIDGTLLLGDEPVEGAVEAVAAARDAGLQVVFLTNVSGGSRDQVAERLNAHGIQAAPEAIYTSASTTAAHLAGLEFATGSCGAVAMLGTDGLRRELEAVGLRVVRADRNPDRAEARLDAADVPDAAPGADAIAAVVIGLDRDYDFTRTEPLAPAVVARVAGGDVPLLACNTDLTYPGPGGEPRPGCGRLVQLVEAQTGHKLDYAAGKPEPHMLEQAAADLGVGPGAVIMIGDSITSDVGMARRGGCLWVYLRRDEGVGPSVGPASAGDELAGKAAGEAQAHDEDDPNGLVITSMRDLVTLFAEAPQKDLRARLDGVVDKVMPRCLRRYREQIMYLLIGGWNTLFGYAVFALMYWAWQDRLPATVILILSYVVAVTNNYICYRYLVFRSRGRMHHEMGRFLVIYGVTLAGNLIVLPLALRTLPLNAYVIQALYNVVVVVASYLGNRLWAFRERPAQTEGSSAATPKAMGTPKVEDMPDSSSHDAKD